MGIALRVINICNTNRRAMPRRLNHSIINKVMPVSQFKFRLQSLLKYRKNRRDQCRMILAEILATDQKLINRKSEFQNNRQETLAEIKQRGTAGTVDIDGIAARRFHSSHLTFSMMGIDQERTLVSKQIEFCRLTLIQADQDVKVLEKLREKQQAEFNQKQEKKANHAREEAWSAMNR